eukprot:CAMPEP_0115553364 /NCGR_PEP_ID=MMETSP0271-20121206/96733_1 /TAXON_ID=71861 /ORGANISM="Scrippsiella trochoidea, Strain CCMP3099" /LENGTH=78 /DNA_ID=CAMNT_0002987043 /DNA_START=163 /DNA_END=396 /DNA_ORIENTATION=+
MPLCSIIHGVVLEIAIPALAAPLLENGTDRGACRVPFCQQFVCLPAIWDEVVHQQERNTGAASRDDRGDPKSSELVSF